MDKIFPRKSGYKIALIGMMLLGIAFLIMLALVNAFPIQVLVIFLMLMLLLIFATSLLFANKKRGLRILGICFLMVFVTLYGTGTYYLANAYSMFARISIDESQSTGKQVDVTKEPFNVYITGIDQWDSEKGYDLERSDVNMIVTVSPKTGKILLTSIPRDSYVPLHKNGAMDKLTHTGIYGVNETIKTVEDWLDVDLSYYVKMNFSAVVKIINAIDGVDVYSSKSFVPTKRCWWTVKKGWNHMNGKEALAFARERKVFEGGDSTRVSNQQKVVKAVIEKVFGSNILLTKYGDIMKIAGESMQTNMPVNAIQAFVKMQLMGLGTWEIDTQKIEGDYAMEYVASLSQKNKYEVYKPKEKSVEKVREKIKKTMNPTKGEIRKRNIEQQKNFIEMFIKRNIGKEK